MSTQDEDEQLMEIVKSVARKAYCDAKGYDYPPDEEVLLPHEAFDKIKAREQSIRGQAEKEARVSESRIWNEIIVDGLGVDAKDWTDYIEPMIGRANERYAVLEAELNRSFSYQITKSNREIRDALHSTNNSLEEK